MLLFVLKIGDSGDTVCAGEGAATAPAGGEDLPGASPGAAARAPTPCSSSRSTGNRWGIFLHGGLEITIFQICVLAQKSPPRHIWGCKSMEMTQKITRNLKKWSELSRNQKKIWNILNFWKKKNFPDPISSFLIQAEAPCWLEVSREAFGPSAAEPSRQRGRPQHIAEAKRRSPLWT